MSVGDGAGTGVEVGGTGVAAGGTGVAVDGIEVGLGGTAVAVGGMRVAAGGIGVGTVSTLGATGAAATLQPVANAIRTASTTSRTLAICKNYPHAALNKRATL